MSTAVPRVPWYSSTLCRQSHIDTSSIFYHSAYNVGTRMSILKYLYLYTAVHTDSTSLGCSQLTAAGWAATCTAVCAMVRCGRESRDTVTISGRARSLRGERHAKERGRLPVGIPWRHWHNLRGLAVPSWQLPLQLCHGAATVAVAGMTCLLVLDLPVF